MIKLKIAQMREKFNLPEYDGNFDKLRLNIISLQNRLGFNYKPKVEVKPEPKTEKPKMSVNDKIMSLRKVK